MATLRWRVYSYSRVHRQIIVVFWRGFLDMDSCPEPFYGCFLSDT